MNEPPTWQDELQALCEAVLEDRLTEEQQRRLEELVLQWPAARRFYVEYLHQHACLQWGTDEPAARPLPFREVRPAARVAPRRMWAAGLLAASVLLAVGILFGRRAIENPATGPRAGQAPAPVATLSGSRSCKWDAGTLPTEVGARLGAGRLRLAEGIATLTFAGGAEVMLEAPADLELISAQRCVLHSGRLVARVPPPAIGFVVDTPTAVLKDLGTEFGVNVRDGQTADVQVFNGIVDAQHRSSGRTERLLTGDNRRFDADNVVVFAPQAEPPVKPTESRPAVAGARVVQLSTATGRGKDAYVQPLYPSPNSSDILLLVKNTHPETSDYNRKAYVGIDLEPVRGTKIVDAQLSFTYTPTGMGFASQVPDATFVVYGLTDETLDGWDEKTLRWATAPANAAGGAKLDFGKVVRLGTFEVAQGAQQGMRSVSGPALVDFLSRDKNGLATFILVRETRGSGRGDLVHGFANKHHPSLPPPTLKLTVMPPEK